MENPFCYGEAVAGEFFTDREEEIKMLKSTLKSGQNAIIISPRRYGKTSLIKKVLSDLKKENLLTVYVDLFPATSKEKFISIYAKAIAENLVTKTKKALLVIRQFLPRLIPRLVVKTDGGAEFEFAFDSHSKSHMTIFEDLYEAVYKIARRRKKQAVVVFDEFQEILNFGDEEIERNMRSHFQFHRNVSYVFLGSKTHLMYDIFNDSKRPFYKSGMFFPLKKIPSGLLGKWIKKRFMKSKIQLEKEALNKIIELTANHPYFAQMLCHFVWNLYHTKKTISLNEIEDSFNEALTTQNENYLNTYDNLTGKQRQFVIALANKPQANVFSKDFLFSNKLGTSSGVQRIIKSLTDKSIIDRENGKYIFYDAFFPLWLKRQYL